MPTESDLSLLAAFPGARYLPEARLVTWHPRGVLDEQVADRMLDFIECEERIVNAPFDRFTDLNGLTEIRLKLSHAFRTVERRRAGYEGPPVKSAFFCEWAVGLGIARLYEALMEGAAIQVHAFRSREAAAVWLRVEPALLLPPTDRENRRGEDVA